MANSNIKLFDENKANMLGDEAYNTNTQRLGGVQAGVASSQLQNKFQYQMSLVAYAIAQMMIANNLNAMDSDAVTTFVSNLSNSVLQKVIDKASTADAISGTNDTKWMTPALVKAYVTNWASGSSTSWKNMVINGTLMVTGATTLQSSLTVSGKTTINGAAEFGSTVLLGRDPTVNLQAATKAYVDKGDTVINNNAKFELLKTLSNTTLKVDSTTYLLESGFDLKKYFGFYVEINGKMTITTTGTSTGYVGVGITTLPYSRGSYGLSQDNPLFSVSIYANNDDVKTIDFIGKTIILFGICDYKMQKQSGNVTITQSINLVNKDFGKLLVNVNDMILTDKLYIRCFESGGIKDYLTNTKFVGTVKLYGMKKSFYL